MVVFGKYANHHASRGLLAVGPRHALLACYVSYKGPRTKLVRERMLHDTAELWLRICLQ